MSKKVKMFAARLPEATIEKIKLYARATGKTDADALCQIIDNHQLSAPIRKAVEALIAADKAAAPPASTIESHEGTPEYFMELEKRIADSQVSTMRMPDPRGPGHMPLQIAPRVPKSKKR